mmetsp:Transcript_2731/g.4673  ORF Transcript_2731/g.4673 Transcript_2731/m.4673 type:complete len:228 (-) Transcript_2731:1081-1764(-)
MKWSVPLWLTTFCLASRTQHALPAHPAFTVPTNNSTFPTDYWIIEDKEVYKRWRSIVQRKVQTSGDKVINFDIIGQVGSGAVIIFAWNSTDKTATIIREYNPGPHEMLWGLAAGMIEDKHGDDPKVAAECELEEECHLRGGRWYSLSERPLAMDKYVTTKIHPYLVVDPEQVCEESVRPLDEEEDIEIVSGLTIEEILGMIQRAEMNIVGAWASLVAINKLHDLGEL